MRFRRRWEIRESVPRWKCLLFGGLVGFITLILLPFVLETVAEILWGMNYVHDFGAIIGSEGAVLGTLLLVDLVAAYLLGRHVFMGMRWRAVWTATPFCSGCGYDLTGNVSGTCPECGTAVPERLPAPQQGNA